MQPRKQYTRLTTPRIMLWTVGVVIVLLGFVFLWLIRSVLFLVFVSLLVATGIEPLVNWLKNKGRFRRPGRTDSNCRALCWRSPGSPGSPHSKLDPGNYCNSLYCSLATGRRQ